jgi:ATP-dependent RNA helicase DDX46/PRP5
MFRHILDQPRLREGEGPVGLVMAPARELAFQITNEAKKFTKALSIRVTCVYGGASVADQIGDLKRGADIVVCTPGRMIDILCMQAGKMVTLKRATMVVMDEADRMFDMGFEPQIKMIMQNIRPDKQVVLFSATFPKQIEKLARAILKLPLEIIIGERSSVNKDIKQIVEVHDERDRYLRLLQLLGIWYDKGSVLIFVESQDKCDQLFQDLLKSGYPGLSLHGGKDQLDRDHTLHEFKTLVKTVMVATSVAGRGLDVPEIICVINYNCPNHLEDYVHRVGRTGRAGRKGTAYTFISPLEEQYAHIMVKALTKAGEPIPNELQDLENSFKAKVERGEAQWAKFGFEGKGFTFEADEMNETQKLASMQRKMYEIEQGIVDDEIEIVDDDIDYPADEEGASNAAALGVNGVGVSSSSSAIDKLKAAATGNQSAATVEAQTALAKALQIANKLSKPVTAGMHFSDELEINDYPHPARRKVTNRLTLDQITDMTGTHFHTNYCFIELSDFNKAIFVINVGTNIISRGSFVPPGKKPEEGERKLFLVIEGPTELQVKQARLEIVRQLEEETLRLGASGATSASMGRYGVI